jgi:hypothetical protein
MCRNIRTLYNFEPPASEEEIRAAAQQYVRKISGFNSPLRANEAAFQTAIDEVAEASRDLLRSLEKDAPRWDRLEEAAKEHERALARFGG